MLTFGKAVANPKLHPVKKMVRRKTGKVHQQTFWVEGVEQLAQRDAMLKEPEAKRPVLKLGRKMKVIEAGPTPDPKPAEKKVIRLKGREPHAAERASDEAKRKVALRVLMDRAKKARGEPASRGRHLEVLGKLLAAERARDNVPSRDLNMIMEYALGHKASADVRQFAADPTTNLNDLLKDEDMRSGLALMAGNANPLMLSPGQVKKMQLAGIIDERRELNDFGIQIVSTFKKWLERQSQNLMNLVGSGETKRAEYYVPEELKLAEGTIRANVALSKSERGVQATYRLKVKPPDSNKVFTAIYKPAEGEADERPGAIDPGTAYRRERAAYEIDQLFGLGVVPPCVIRVIGGKPGSVQTWVAGETAFETGDDAWTGEADRDEVKAIAVLDYLTQNTDRHTNNFMVDRHSGRPENKLWAIDHGYAFPHDADIGAAYYLSRPHQWLESVKDVSIPKDLLGRMKRIDPNHLKGKLQRLGIEETAIAGVVARFRQLLTTKKLPKYMGRDMW